MDTDVRPPPTPARTLLVIDRPVLAELGKPALDHGVSLTRLAPAANGAPQCEH